MKTKIALSFVFILLFFFACNENTQKNKNAKSKLLVESEHLKDQSSKELLAINASQYGVKYPETFILMQNRKGLRIEYNLDRSNLQIWISPQAGKSFSYIDKNWSNRDDHSNVFDRILLPGIELSTFDSCDWDPFHSKIYFQDQTLHISQIYDQPAVLLWFEKDGLVDFKIHGDEVERSEKTFIINHEDRQRYFQSAAIIGGGEGSFQHQLELDYGRSTYARAHLAPGQVLLIASELQKEKIGENAKEWIKQPIDDILARNEQMIKEDLSTGKFTIKDRPEMQKLLDKSRRVALSMQDFKGFMRSTNQYIYYLLWYRDGGMNVSHISYSGWARPAYDNTKFALLNPNVSNTEPKGEFFGQVMGGPITKWQEDGLFYVVWPAFSHWTQTGDKSLCSGEYLKTMENAMDWLERYCYDEQKGLFGRYYACETPMTGSRGDGYDHATGAPTFKWGSEYEGNTIVRTYDIYVNYLHYSTYLMLSAMQENEEKADEYYRKAKNLEENMVKFLDYEGVLPSYGDLETQSGEMITAKPYGMDIWDYVWGVALPPFRPNKPEAYRDLREQIRSDMTTTEEGYFHCVYFALLTSMDTEIHNEDSIMAAMDMLVPVSIRPGKYLPMPYAMPEMFNMPDGDPFHDVRPLVYSIAPWLSAVTNLGLRRMPFGLSVRGTNYLENIDNYEYQGSLIDVNFKGKGELETIKVNGKELKNSYQIPENFLTEEENHIQVELSDNPKSDNILISSTLKLHSIEEKAGGVNFNMKAYGKNVLTLKKPTRKLRIFDDAGNAVEADVIEFDNMKVFEFEGRGDYIVIMK